MTIHRLVGAPVFEAGSYDAILHLGAHKTATTSLQEWLLQNGDTLKKRGVASVSEYAAIVKATEGWAFLRDRATADIVRRLVDERRSDPSIRRVVYSFEGHLGPAVFRSGSGFYPNRKNPIQYLKDAFADLRVGIVYGVREQAGMIESCYVQHVQEGNAVQFSDYIAPLDLDTLSWQPVLDDLEAAFGAENIAVIRFTRQDSDAPLPHAMMSRLGLSEEPGEFPSSNASYSARGLRIALAVLPHLETAEEKYALRQWTARRFSSRSFPRAELFDPDTRQKLQAAYWRDISAMSAKYTMI